MGPHWPGDSRHGRPSLLRQERDPATAEHGADGEGQPAGGVGGGMRALDRRPRDIGFWQSEQECGNAANDWKFARCSWNLMKQYLPEWRQRVALLEDGASDGWARHRGWPQNSLVVTDPATHRWRLTNDYQVLRHLSRHVAPGARWTGHGPCPWDWWTIPVPPFRRSPEWWAVGISYRARSRTGVRGRSRPWQRGGRGRDSRSRRCVIAGERRGCGPDRRAGRQGRSAPAG